MKHSQGWLEDVLQFRQQAGGRILIMTGSGPGFYAGLGYKPKKTLLETCLHYLATPEYQAIDVFTGLSNSDSNPLPAWQITGATIGRNFIGWQFRASKSDEAQEISSNEPSANISDFDIFADNSWGGQKGDVSKTNFALLPNFPKDPLNDRYRLLLGHTLGLVGYFWNGSQLQKGEAKTNGKHLVIIDESFFKPNPADLNQFRQAPSAVELTHNQGLASQFNALPKYIQNSRVDLIVLGANRYLKDQLSSGRWFLSLLLPQLIPTFGDAQRAEASIGDRIAPLRWSGDIQAIHIDALDKDMPYGSLYSKQKKIDMDWLELMQSTPLKQPRRNAWEELAAMTGLSAVKNSIREMEQLIRVEKKKASARDDYQEKAISGHFVFYGNPGTGKTTVAHLLGRILKELEVLPSDKVVKAERPQLVAGYVGQTAIKTNELIDQAMGGILFIDEAYTLAQGGDNDFGKEAINTLLTRMENDRGHFVVVAAGYRDPMQAFINSNEGLRSRFNDFLDFEDYNAEELYDIFLYMVKQGQNQISLEPEIETQLRDFFKQMYAQRGEKFGNAREVRNFYDRMCLKQAMRLASLNDPASDDDLFTLNLEDIQAAISES